MDLAPERAGAGLRNEVWLVGDDVVRVLASPERAAMEAAVLGRVHLVADVPVAEVRWWSAGPPAVMVQRRLPGVRLSDVAHPSAALRDDLHRVLSAIHSVPLTGAGNLTADLRGEDDRLSTWFTGRVRAEADAAPLGSADRALCDAVLADFDAAGPVLDGQPSSLVHGDLQPTNVLVDGDRVTGVIDWEAAKAGPPALDLGWWDWWTTIAGTPWPLGGDEPVRRLVPRRVDLRELLAAVRTGDARRAAAARARLRSTSA